MILRCVVNAMPCFGAHILVVLANVTELLAAHVPELLPYVPELPPYVPELLPYVSELLSFVSVLLAHVPVAGAFALALNMRCPKMNKCFIGSASRGAACLLSARLP